MSQAVFIDRDGVIVEDTGYVHKIEDFRLCANAVEGLKLLKNHKLFIVTNQSGIGRGYYRLEDFFEYNKKALDGLKKHKIKIQKTYYCPHKPEDNCECRKPKTKFLKEAAKEFGIDLKKSFVIGDRKADIELGKNAGCKTVLVLTGNGQQARSEADADFIAEDLLDAAKWILKNDKSDRKIVSLKRIVQIVNVLKKRNKKIVTTNGVFDILHIGHVNYLEEAKKLGDVLIVGVNTDKSVKLNKGDKRPINDEKSRIGILAGLESIDYAFLFSEKDPRSWLSKIKPDFHVKAGDYKLSQIIEKDVVERGQGKVVLMPVIKGCSTTSIINKILKLYQKQ